MAIDWVTEYGTRVDPPNVDYPNGSFKNATSGVAFDGTPADKKWSNDWLGFLDGLMAKAGIPVSGIPDTAVSSQRYEALLRLFSSFPAYEQVGAVASGVYTIAPVGDGVAQEDYVEGMTINVLITEDYAGGDPAQFKIGSLVEKPLVETDGRAITAAGRLKALSIYVFRYSSASGGEFELVAAPHPERIVFEQTFAPGSFGGSFTTDLTSGYWGGKRTFDTNPVYNEISDFVYNSVGLDFTPPAGEYVIKSLQMFAQIDGVIATVRNKIATSFVAQSMSGGTVPGLANVNTMIKLEDKFTANGTDSFELYNVAYNPSATANNMGDPAFLASPPSPVGYPIDTLKERFMRTEITKVA